MIGRGPRSCVPRECSDSYQPCRPGERTLGTALGEAGGPAAFDSSCNGNGRTYYGNPSVRSAGAINNDPILCLASKTALFQVLCGGPDPGRPVIQRRPAARGLTVEVWMRPRFRSFSSHAAWHSYSPGSVRACRGIGGRGAAVSTEPRTRPFPTASPRTLESLRLRSYPGLISSTTDASGIDAGLSRSTTRGYGHHVGGASVIYKNCVLRKGPAGRARSTLYGTSASCPLMASAPVRFRHRRTDTLLFFAGGCMRWRASTVPDAAEIMENYTAGIS